MAVVSQSVAVLPPPSRAAGRGGLRYELAWVDPATERVVSKTLLDSPEALGKATAGLLAECPGSGIIQWVARFEDGTPAALVGRDIAIARAHELAAQSGESVESLLPRELALNNFDIPAGDGFVMITEAFG